MLIYLLVLAGAFLVDIIPIIGPPAWTVMVFFHLKYHLNIWAVLCFGVTGSSIGRYFYSVYISHFTHRFVSKAKSSDLEYLGSKLTGSWWKIQVVVFIYTLLPVPTTPLFTTFGMAKVNTLKVMPAFFIGKFLSDMYMVFAGKLAATNLNGILHGMVSWKTITGTAIGIIFLLLMLFTDWKALLVHKKLKLNFKVWK